MTADIATRRGDEPAGARVHRQRQGPGAGADKECVLRLRWFFPIALTMGLSLAACVNKPPQSMRVSAVLWPGYEPLYLAGKLGYYGDAPVQIIDYLSNTDAMLAFRNHNLEAGAFTFDEVLRLLADGLDIQVILIMDTSDGGDVILANPGIRSMADLKGKRVAVESSAVGGFVLARALALHGLSLDDIKVVSTNAMEQHDAFRNGKVDAAVTFDPYRTDLLRLGTHEIFSSREIPNEIVDMLVVRRDYGLRHPDTVRALVQGWFRALAYQREHPRESAAYSVNRFNTNVEDYLGGLARLRFASESDNRTMLDPADSPLISNAERFYRVLAQMNVRRTKVAIGTHLSSAYLP